MSPCAFVRWLPSFLAVVFLGACAPLPQTRTDGVIWRPSPNFDQRRPNFVILHHTTNDTAARALNTLTDPRREVSAHYLVARDGTIYQLVDDSSRAWHAGESYWGGQSDLNSASLGIELDNTGSEEFAERQIASLLGLLERLRDRHRIPPENILGHGDVAPTRKVDPSYRFPWGVLAASGFGQWCDEATPPPAPDGFDSILGLQALGYDVASPDAARRAFRRHFAANDGNGELSADENALLQCLIDRKRRR